MQESKSFDVSGGQNFRFDRKKTSKASKIKSSLLSTVDATDFRARGKRKRNPVSIFVTYFFFFYGCSFWE